MLLEDEIFENDPEQVLDTLNYITNAKLNYKDIQRKFLAAIGSADEKVRNEGIKELYREITRELGTSSLKTKTLFMLLSEKQVNRELPGEQDQFYDIVRYGYAEISIDAMRFINSMCRNAKYKETFADHFGMTPEENLDFLQDLAKPYTVDHVRNTFYAAGGNKQIREELDAKIKVCTGNQWDGDFKNQATCGIAEIYHTYKHVKDELGKHGRFWRFFHPIETRRMRGIIKTSAEFLDSAGFNEERDGASAMDFAENNVVHEVKASIDSAKDYCRLEKMQMKQKAKTEKLKEINTARDRLKAAVEKEADPKTSLWHQELAPIFGKYGLTMQTIGKRAGCTWTLGASNEKVIAEKYDIDRADCTEDFSEYVSRTQYDNFQRIVGQVISTKDPVTVDDIVEAIVDVAKVSTALVDRYTMIYELKETKDIAKNSAFGGRDRDFLVKMTDKLLKAANKQDQINKDELADAIDKTMAEYKNPHIKDDSLLIEEKKEILELKNGEWVLKEEPALQEMRSQLVVEEALDKATDKVSASYERKDLSLEKSNLI